MKTHLLTAVLFVVCTTSAWAQSTTVYLPQIADGMEGGPAHWHTTIFIGNSGTTTASGSIAMTQSSGDPMTAQFVDELGNGAARSGQISFQLAPGQSHKYTSTAAEPIQVGLRLSGCGLSLLVVAGMPVPCPRYRNARQDQERSDGET